jgi:hypothetical protein
LRFSVASSSTALGVRLSIHRSVWLKLLVALDTTAILGYCLASMAHSSIFRTRLHTLPKSRYGLLTVRATELVATKCSWEPSRQAPYASHKKVILALKGATAEFLPRSSQNKWPHVVGQQSSRVTLHFNASIQTLLKHENCSYFQVLSHAQWIL